MAYGQPLGFDRTWKFAGKTAWGYPFNYLKNVIEHTFGYTHPSKKVSAGTAGAVLGSTATVVAGVTVTTGITNPDVPRVLAVTCGGTTADFAASTVKIYGTNVEGKSIVDTITLSDNQTGQVAGSLVFKTVSKVVLSKADGTGGTFTIDTLNKIGINHRVPPSYTTAVVVHDATLDSTKPTAEAAPSASNFDNEFVEKNWVTPATTPDGSNFLYIFYWFHKVKVAPPNDAPEFYSTTTSTSTSSTSTSTSTSSTSTSISTSSTSTSQTTTSTSSTSTSTTTLPI